MKWLDIKQLSLRMVLATVLCAGAMPLQAQSAAPTDTISVDSTDSVHSPTRYERRIDRYVLRWSKLIPDHSTLQYAGSIGLISGGIGWSYGKNLHWETELLVGFLPKYHSRSAHATFTVKERYIPWRCHVHPQWTIEPLTAGAFFNTISGEDFWRHQPSRYPKKYYGMPTKLRSNIFFGQRLRYNIPNSKRIMHQAISLYYEISTCDIYLISKITNKSYPWSKTLSLAIGIKWDM